MCQMATVPCGWMRPEEPVSAASRSCLTSCEKLRIAPRATSCVFANACVWGVGPRFPAPSVEFFDLEAREVDAFEAAHVDHVLRGVGSWPVERRHAAVAAEEMARDVFRTDRSRDLCSRRAYKTAPVQRAISSSGRRRHGTLEHAFQVASEGPSDDRGSPSRDPVGCMRGPMPVFLDALDELLAADADSIGGRGSKSRRVWLQEQLLLCNDVPVLLTTRETSARGHRGMLYQPKLTRIDVRGDEGCELNRHFLEHRRSYHVRRRIRIVAHLLEELLQLRI